MLLKIHRSAHDRVGFGIPQSIAVDRKLISRHQDLGLVVHIPQIPGPIRRQGILITLESKKLLTQPKSSAYLSVPIGCMLGSAEDMRPIAEIQFVVESIQWVFFQSQLSQKKPLGSRILQGLGRQSPIPVKLDVSEPVNKIEISRVVFKFCQTLEAVALKNSEFAVFGLKA